MNDLIGKKFAHWYVISVSSKSTSKHQYYFCKCDCGVTKDVSKHNLLNGKSKSCGCCKGENVHKTHGLSSERIYSIWKAMRLRCYNKNGISYKYYGEKGITVCEEWKNDFQAFYDWAIANGYKENLTIDRINNNGNYEPSNCRWVTRKEQMNNTSKNRVFCVDGKNFTVAELARKHNMPYYLLSERINFLHWDIEKAINTPRGNKFGR